MKKKDLNKLALMGITGGIIIAAQSNAHADEAFSNTVSGHYLAGRECGSKCSTTAYNDRGSSNQGYFYNKDQNQTYFYQQAPSESSRMQQNTRQRNSNQQQYYDNQQYQYNNQGDQDQNYWQGSYENPGYVSQNDNAPNQDSSDSQFKLQLSVQGKSDFDNLSPEGKAYAIKAASHDCKGKNDCKGQNACQSEKNSCAGLGACKGQSSCKMSPDKAVKIATMKDKRTSLNGSPKSTGRI